MGKPPLIEAPNKVISVVADESSSELKEQWDYFEKIVARVTKGSIASLLVLTIILRELPKLRKGQKVGFDFGTFKEFELRRTK